MSPQDFQKYGFQLLKVPSYDPKGAKVGAGQSNSFSYILYNPQYGGMGAGSRTVDNSVAQSLINQGIVPQTTSDLSALPGATVGRSTITNTSDLDKLLTSFKSNDSFITDSAKQLSDAATFNANPANTTSTVGAPIQYATPPAGQPSGSEVVKKNDTGTTSNTGTNTTPASTALTYNPAWSSFGMTQDVWNQLNPTQQAMYSVAHNTGVALQNANASDVTVSSALQAASTDPTLVAKYSDALNIDKQAFTQSISQLAQATGTQSQQQQMQFEQERKALAEQNAAAGTAYSGFRTKAQNDLATNEGNIVTSSRAQTQKSLNDATTAFESKYGTNATTPASLNFSDPFNTSKVGLSGLATAGTDNSSVLSGTLAGGITGTVPIQKTQDTQTLASNFINAGKTQPVVSA